MLIWSPRQSTVVFPCFYGGFSAVYGTLLHHAPSIALGSYHIDRVCNRSSFYTFFCLTSDSKDLFDVSWCPCGSLMDGEQYPDKSARLLFYPWSRKRAEYFSVIIPMLARDFSKRVIWANNPCCIIHEVHFTRCGFSTISLSRRRVLTLSFNMRVISYFMSIFPLFLTDDSDKVIISFLS